MCQHSILVERENGKVRYCHDCKTYNIAFNNLLLNLTFEGFEAFKNNLAECYEVHTLSRCKKHYHVRDVVFNTKMEGLQFLFSTVEVGELLSLMQEAQLEELFLEK